MTVPCPAWQFPTGLEERGPAEDPTILLTGVAHLGNAAVQLVAIRINATLQWTPDFRHDVAEESYQVNGLGETLETALEDLQTVASELGDLLGDGGSGVVELATGHYRVCVMPGAVGS